MGWGRLKNGELIRKAESDGFAVFVTCDRNLRYQQNLQDRTIALLVLWTNYWPALKSQSGRIAAALTGIPPGQYLEVGDRV
jgi:hypothetical protein